MDHTIVKYYPSYNSSPSNDSSEESCYCQKHKKSKVNLENPSNVFKKCRLSFEDNISED